MVGTRVLNANCSAFYRGSFHLSSVNQDDCYRCKGQGIATARYGAIGYARINLVSTQIVHTNRSGPVEGHQFEPSSISQDECYVSTREERRTSIQDRLRTGPSLSNSSLSFPFHFPTEVSYGGFPMEGSTIFPGHPVPVAWEDELDGTSWLSRLVSAHIDVRSISYVEQDYKALANGFPYILTYSPASHSPPVIITQCSFQ